MIRKNGENGYILLDAVIISFLLLALSSGMYFLKINSINRINCISSINADYIAQYYLDRMVYLNTFNSKCTIVSGGVYYTVQERVKNIIAYNEYHGKAYEFCKQAKGKGVKVIELGKN